MPKHKMGGGGGAQAARRIQIRNQRGNNENVLKFAAAQSTSLPCNGLMDAFQAAIDISMTFKIKIIIVILVTVIAAITIC